MFRGKRIISGISWCLCWLVLLDVKGLPKQQHFTYEENAAGNIVITGTLLIKGESRCKGYCAS